MHGLSAGCDQMKKFGKSSHLHGTFLIGCVSYSARKRGMVFICLRNLFNTIYAAVDLSCVTCIVRRHGHSEA